MQTILAPQCAKCISSFCLQGPGGSVSQVVGLPNNSYKPITNTSRLCKLPKGCPRLVSLGENFYHLLAHGRWFSPGTPNSSTTKTGHHAIAEILLKVALSTNNQIKSFFFVDLLWLQLMYVILAQKIAKLYKLRNIVLNASKNYVENALNGTCGARHLNLTM